MNRPPTGPATAPPETSSAPKAPWHPPTLEEVDYSATEVSGVGAIYDAAIYASH